MKKYIAEYIVPVEKKGKDCILDFFNTKPLIRCKECKYSIDEYDDGECYCDYKKNLQYIKDWNHYCSWAERREK